MNHKQVRNQKRRQANRKKKTISDIALQNKTPITEGEAT